MPVCGVPCQRSWPAVQEPASAAFASACWARDHHAAGNADADDIHPALVEVEQMAS